MSNGTYQVYGDVYGSLVTTDKNQSEYNNIGEVNREIILEVDPIVNFANYDILNGNSFGSDGNVDFIYIIYRNVTGNTLMYYSGIAQLSVSQTINVDNKQIVDNSYIGGGVHQKGGYNGRDYTMYVAAHEMGHYLFGGGHIDYASNLCLMSGSPVWNSSRGMHSWERQRLSWITYTDKSTDGSVTMSDYITSRQAYRVPINSNEYFLIENRLKQSPHDLAGDNGFYIYKITGAASYPPTIDVLCADGNWNFNFNPSTKIITRVNQNPSSSWDEMNLEIEYDTDGNGYPEYYPCRTPFYFKDAAWGDNEDAFDLTFNNVLSPVSNPRTTNSGSLAFAIEVTGTNTLQFYLTNPYSGAPSKPQNPRLSSNAPVGYGYVRFSWDANNEPDIVNYEVSRKVTELGGVWEVIANTTNTYFVDVDFTYTDPYGDFHCTYRVRAKDSQNKYSVYSNETTGRAEYTHKKALNNNELIISNIDLLQNYPNPFNPATTINYQIPQDAFVTIKVYDILGKEVVTLVNENKLAGYYKTDFNASYLTSGVYVYTIQINNTSQSKGSRFIQSKKMLLIK